MGKKDKKHKKKHKDELLSSGEVTVDDSPAEKPQVHSSKIQSSALRIANADDFNCRGLFQHHFVSGFVCAMNWINRFAGEIQDQSNDRTAYKKFENLPYHRY